jgi:putative tricarboxylic transport membrane protein
VSSPLNRDADAAGDHPRLHSDYEAGAPSQRRDLGALLIAVGLFGLAWVIFSDASGYPVRRSHARFGPAIVPFIVASGIVVLGALTVVSALRGQFEARDRLNIAGFAWLVAALIAELALIYGGGGFILASTVLFGFAARAFGQTTMVRSLAIGAVLSCALFLLFQYGLGLSLPAGPLEGFINSLLR